MFNLFKRVKELEEQLETVQQALVLILVKDKRFDLLTEVDENGTVHTIKKRGRPSNGAKYGFKKDGTHKKKPGRKKITK